MQTLRQVSRTRSAPGALFVGSAVGSTDCLVVTGAAGVAGLGAVALVACFIPGSVCARVLVMPQA